MANYFLVRFSIRKIYLFWLAIITASLLTACKNGVPLFTDLDSQSNKVVEPTVKFTAPTKSIGNTGSTFIFGLIYQGVTSVNLTASFIDINTTGTVQCDSPIISGGASQSPTVSIVNCDGTGSFNLILASGSANASSGQVPGATSPSADVDNSRPLVTVALKAGGSTVGDTSTTFDFSVTYDGAENIYLTSNDVIVTASNLSCDAPVVTNGTTNAPIISITNCVDNISRPNGGAAGVLSIEISADTSDNGATQKNLISDPGPSVSILTCPNNYIKVPALTGYTSKDFCIMKYEARVTDNLTGSLPSDWGCIDDNGAGSEGASCAGVANSWSLDSKYVPHSTFSDRPWRKISQPLAVTKCSSLGTDFGLTSNDQWQTIARNIELVANNWSVSDVGIGRLNQGHSDGSPAQPLAANFEDSFGCSGTGQSCIGGNWNNQKRTHTLSNNEVIWDFAGNVDEWVRETNANSFGNSDFFDMVSDVIYTSEFSLGAPISSSTPMRNAKGHFGPATPYSLSSLSTGNNRGSYGRFTSGTAGGIFRGGDWSNIYTGIFNTILNFADTASINHVGFRCTWAP